MFRKYSTPHFAIQIGNSWVQRGGLNSLYLKINIYQKQLVLIGITLGFVNMEHFITKKRRKNQWFVLYYNDNWEFRTYAFNFEPVNLNNDKKIPIYITMRPLWGLEVFSEVCSILIIVVSWISWTNFHWIKKMFDLCGSASTQKLLVHIRIRWYGMWIRSLAFLKMTYSLVPGTEEQVLEWNGQV